MVNDSRSNTGIPGNIFLKLYLISWSSPVSWLKDCENSLRLLLSLSSKDFCSLLTILETNPNLLENNDPMATRTTRLKNMIYAKTMILLRTSFERISRKGKAIMMIRLQIVRPESFSVTATKVFLIRLPYFLVAAMIR